MSNPDVTGVPICVIYIYLLEPRGSDRYIYDMEGNCSHISILRTRTEMVLETLVFSPFNHLTWLVA
jgi:hypothetical protein